MSDPSVAIPAPDVQTVLVDIVLSADPTVGYASIQNAIPIIRAIEITNRTGADLVELHVEIHCDPPFANGALFHFDRLLPGETRRIAPVDLPPAHDYLATLNEAVSASIVVVARQADRELSRLTTAVEVLAYDQWAGTRSLPDLLAAFCMPNNPAIDILLAKASRLLRDHNPDQSLDGYQSGERGRVWNQCSAIYSTVVAESIQYAEPPASFGTDGQKIRAPDRIASGGIATCLDLALFFCSCLEQAGLHPVILVKNGHAWAGVWLVKTEFTSAFVEDPQEVRKRVASGELVVFETTGVATGGRAKMPLKAAMEIGMSYLVDEASFRYAIDVHQARNGHIRPLPSRAEYLGGATNESDSFAPSIESMPLLPPLDVGNLAPRIVDGPETPERRLAKWKSRLLDLTLRNRLLNFKPTKSTLALVAPDTGALEDALSDGVEFKLRPLPELMDGADPRSSAVHAARFGGSPLDQMARSCLDDKELLTRASVANLNGTLQALFTAARTGIEEGGANTLYLAIGMLKWADTPDSDRVCLAPLLLIPVSLKRQSVRSGFRISRHDDETIVNHTLLQLLLEQFEITPAGLDPLPTDGKGVDVPRVLQAFRLAISEQKGWEVLDEACLGIFSFTKYLMWKDLQDRTADLMRNDVVRHLIEHPGEAMPHVESEDRWNRPDDHRPQDILAPMPADSSQLRAMFAIDAGLNLALEGPPGTGKSQTITNVIAQALAKGRRVLFVSEKMAALDVVRRRLEQVGLGPFCLELHSAKASKAEVLRQLDRALKAGTSRNVQEWEQEASRLEQLRAALNGLCTAIHAEHRNGLTVFEALGTSVAGGSSVIVPMPWPDPEVHNPEDLASLRNLMRKVATTSGRVGMGADHPLAAVRRTTWSPGWQDVFGAVCAALNEKARTLSLAVSGLMKALNVQATGFSWNTLLACDRLANILQAAPRITAPLAQAATGQSNRYRLKTIAQRGTERDARWGQLGPGWRPTVADLNGLHLLAQWSTANADWWPKKWFSRREVRALLVAHREDRRWPAGQTVESVLATLQYINGHDEFLRGEAAFARDALADEYAGLRTDWLALDRRVEWLNSLAAVMGDFASADDELAGRIKDGVLAGAADPTEPFRPSAPAGRACAVLQQAFAAFVDARSTFEQCAEAAPDWLGAPFAGGFLERLTTQVRGWNESHEDLQPWCVWQGARKECVDAGLLEIVRALENGAVAPSEGVSCFERSYQTWWLKKQIDRTPQLAMFSGVEHSRLVSEFRAADEKFETLTAKYVVAKLAAAIPIPSAVTTSANSELGLIQRQIGMKARQMPVRKLVEKLPTLLPRLKPCLLMSPLSIAQYLDASQAGFDLVVFDEASQISVWDAVGAIARGKRLAVVGDPKQLPPTSFFDRAVGDDEAIEEGQVEDLESILDECLAAGMKQMRLQWHYRSRHESLITFSNVSYYDSELITFPSAVTSDRAVRFVKLSGVYDRGATKTNRTEAEAIVRDIEAHYLRPGGPSGSLGVVTFNMAQQRLIDTLVDNARALNPLLDEALSNTGREPLFVKNLENVQGDERDHIMFSVTYGTDAAGKTMMNFGPLNLDGGHRRLNVAITRARESVTVYSTLASDQIDLSKVRARGVQDLKRYLEYADRGARALIDQSVPTGREPDSPFEVAVINALRDKGWVIEPQVGCSEYRIDIGIIDPAAPGKYLAGVECDGRMYHSAASARDRDRLRQSVLEGLGWRLIRIWSTDWWLNPRREVERVHQALLAIQNTPEAGPASVAPARNEPEPEPPTRDDPPVPERLASVAPVYQPATLCLGPSEEFYEFTSNAAIVTQLRDVISAEGPISEPTLFRRVARAWNLERTGSAIVRRLKQLVPRDITKTREGKALFYWPEHIDPMTWHGFRGTAADESAPRSISEICLEELANIAVHVVDHGGMTPVEDVCRSVSRLCGVSRTAADAQARVMLAINRAAKAGRLSLDGVNARPGV